MKNFLHDIKAAFSAGLQKWRECRAMRSGACPDLLPF